MALYDHIIIKKGRIRYRLAPDETKQDDLPEDFYRAISMDESIGMVETGIREIIKRHQQSESVTQ